MLERTETNTEPIIGVVTDCKKLNIRVSPTMDSSVICEAPTGTEVLVDLAESTTNWYSVCTAAGISGYCMKTFIKITN